MVEGARTPLTTVLCLCPVGDVLPEGGRRPWVLRGLRGLICRLSNAATCKDVHGYLWSGCVTLAMSCDRKDCNSAYVKCFQMSGLYGDGKHLGLHWSSLPRVPHSPPNGQWRLHLRTQQAHLGQAACQPLHGRAEFSLSLLGSRARLCLLGWFFTEPTIILPHLLEGCDVAL